MIDKSMVVPGSKWIMKNPRVNPQTKEKMASVDIEIEVVQFVDEHIRRGVTNEGTPIQTKAGPRVHYRYLETSLAIELDVAGSDGGCSLATFISICRPL